LWLPLKEHADSLKGKKQGNKHQTAWEMTRMGIEGLLLYEGDCKSKVGKGKKRISLVGRRQKGKKKKIGCVREKLSGVGGRVGR
jgi:hypothetical protein